MLSVCFKHTVQKCICKCYKHILKRSGWLEIIVCHWFKYAVYLSALKEVQQGFIQLMLKQHIMCEGWTPKWCISNDLNYSRLPSTTHNMLHFARKHLIWSARLQIIPEPKPKLYELQQIYGFCVDGKFLQFLWALLTVSFL